MIEHNIRLLVKCDGCPVVEMRGSKTKRAACGKRLVVNSLVDLADAHAQIAAAGWLLKKSGHVYCEKCRTTRYRAA